MLISVVIPVNNESQNIEQLIREITTSLDANFPYQIVVVDDASTDNTIDVLTKIKKDLNNLKVIHHKRNYGQSAAIVTGVTHADGEIIVTIDGDGQNDPADIPKLISTLLENNNCHMVTGYRKKRNDSLWKILSSKIANSVRRSLLKDDTIDTGCGLKVFYKRTFIALPFFDHMHRFLPALVKMNGGKVLSVEVNHRPRVKGKSHYGILDRLMAGIVDLFGVYWLSRRTIKTLVQENAID